MINSHVTIIALQLHAVSLTKLCAFAIYDRNIKTNEILNYSM